MALSIQSIWDEFIQPILQKSGIDIRRFPPKPEPHWTEVAFTDLLLRRKIAKEKVSSDASDFLLFCIQHAHESHSQLFQDLFVRYHLKDKVKGFFVEFGAANGVNLSNTKSLEDRLSWGGIVAEPARCWHEDLLHNRSCIVDTRCVWNKTGEVLKFNEVSLAEFSTIDLFSGKDAHSEIRKQGNVYDVETITLEDLLNIHNAPKDIDYLSIDTEGSELSILESFDFSKYRIRLITVEHNGTLDRQKIFNLLEANNFSRKFTEFSKFDDWYASNEL